MKLERLALAAFLAFSAPGFCKDEPLVLKPTDERGQRLFDQAVKLSRRFESDKVKKFQPLKSMLMELSDYHEDETAAPLALDGLTRQKPVPVGPWALARMARLASQEGDDEAAFGLYQRLGPEFVGLQVLDVGGDGASSVPEKAEIAGMRGSIDALSSAYAKAKSGEAADKAVDLIFDLQKTHEAGAAALSALWELLALQGADAESWEKMTLKLEKYEEEPKRAAAAILALSKGYAELKLSEKSLKLQAMAAKKYPDLAALKDLPAGAFKNLLPETENLEIIKK